MDLKLRNFLLTLQEDYGKAVKKLDTVREDYRRLLKIGRKIYKQSVTADPTLAEVAVWNNFREELGIPVGVVEPPAADPPQDDAKATQDTLVAITAVNKLGTYDDLTSEKKAALLAELEAALVNARISLS